MDSAWIGGCWARGTEVALVLACDNLELVRIPDLGLVGDRLLVLSRQLQHALAADAHAAGAFTVRAAALAGLAVGPAVVAASPEKKRSIPIREEHTSGIDCAYSLAATMVLIITIWTITI